VRAAPRRVDRGRLERVSGLADGALDG
jgi:hypothetical protein